MPKNQPLRIADSRRAAAAGGAGGSAPAGHTHDSRYYTEAEIAALLAQYVALANANYVDLTDAGATTLHKHDHGGMDGLADDDHSQYALLAGRAGGQSLAGGNAANDDLTLQGTTHATRTTSYLLLQPNGGNVGIGTSAPEAQMHVVGNTLISGAARVGRFFAGTDGGGMGAGACDARAASGTTLSLFSIDEYSTPPFTRLTFGTKYTSAGLYTTGPIVEGGKENATDGQYGYYMAFYTRPHGGASTERARITAAGNLGIGTTAPTISDGVGLHIAGKILRLATSKTPATAGATGNVGEICWDGSYIYVATAANTWERAPLIPWTYERHIQIVAVADGTVANQATPVDFFTAGGLQFATSGTKYAYCQWEVPDDWDGGNVYFEIDWFPDSGAISGTAAVRWTVEYRAIAEGELINNGTSVTLDNGAGGDTGDYSQYQTKHTRVTLAYNNANQPLTKQDHIYFKISRDTAVANDFGGSVTVTAYEIIYNSVGYPTSN